MDIDIDNPPKTTRKVMQTLKALPKSYAVHWRPNTKALVVQAVEAGWLMLDEALSRYRMSLEEYRDWQREARQMDIAALHARSLRALKMDGKRLRGRRGRAEPPPEA